MFRRQYEESLAARRCSRGRSPGRFWNVAERDCESLRQYVQLKRAEDRHLSFEKARESIYDQPFYPLVTHFTLAFQPSAVARMRFVRRIVESVASPKAIVTDLGCGSGAMLCEVLRMRPTWTGYGLDISEAAINYARRLAVHKVLQRARNFKRAV